MKPLNIVLSGSLFWNPGDSFVREGVLRAIHCCFPDREINSFFYNIYPGGTRDRHTNCVSESDLSGLAKYIDAVIVCGLSFGSALKDFYGWIIAVGLEQKTMLLGADYSNSYFNQVPISDVESIIFQNTRLIIARTNHQPGCILKNFVCLPCPSLLCGTIVKIGSPTRDKQIQEVGFSIQLPHSDTVENHGCEIDFHGIAVEMMKWLAPKVRVRLIAHHKAEYIYFLKQFEHLDIRVFFSSFHQDYRKFYEPCDMVISTRLHSGFFANSQGIRAIIINNTPRHLGALAAVPFCSLVSYREELKAAYKKAQEEMLARDIPKEILAFKHNLLNDYVSVLKGALENQ